MKYFRILLLIAFLICCASSNAQSNVDGVKRLISDAVSKGTPESHTVINIPKDEYLLDADQLPEEELYISNTDLRNPKKVGLYIRGLKNAILDFNGSELKTRGPVIALVLEDCENVVVRNFHIDSDSPAMVQTEIVQNDDNGLVIRLPDYCRASVDENSGIIFVGDGWQGPARIALAFDPQTKHTLHNVADILANFNDARLLSDGSVYCPNWKDSRLSKGSIIVLRCDTFNLCGFFINNCRKIRSENIQIHYAPAKAVVAQRSEDLVFDGVSVCFRDRLGGARDPRFFTANADAIHCSCCKGSVVVENGVYENMMDDAINVHGIYVKTMKQINDRTVEVRYMHSAASGFEWAVPGDEISFIRARSMQPFVDENGKNAPFAVVESIKAVDKESAFGANRFEIQFRDPIPKEVVVDEDCALENRTQTPTVVYRNNLVRNNRARGALFSTYKSVLIENNVFDWVSGTALLFCGDANGWYESGPCQNVVIRKNRFVNCMTAFYQFCEAPISIFPEIPDFNSQLSYYDGGNEDSFLIEENVFCTFDRPLLYARSVDGVIFRNNRVEKNNDCAPIASDKKQFVFENANRIRIYDNQFDSEFNPKDEVELRRVPDGGIKFSEDGSF